MNALPSPWPIGWGKQHKIAALEVAFRLRVFHESPVMKLFPLLLALVSALFISCERHDFDGPDGTKQLHEHHGAAHAEHGEHAAEGHEDKAKEEGDHAPKQEHGH